MFSSPFSRQHFISFLLTPITPSISLRFPSPLASITSFICNMAGDNAFLDYAAMPRKNHSFAAIERHACRCHTLMTPLPLLPGFRFLFFISPLFFFFFFAPPAMPPPICHAAAIIDFSPPFSISLDAAADYYACYAQKDVMLLMLRRCASECARTIRRHRHARGASVDACDMRYQIRSDHR